MNITMRGHDSLLDHNYVTFQIVANESHNNNTHSYFTVDHAYLKNKKIDEIVTDRTNSFRDQCLTNVLTNDAESN